MATGPFCLLDTSFTYFLVVLLVSMLRLVNKWKENLALVMEKWLVKVWQTGPLIWPVWWPELSPTLERAFV